MSTGSESAQQYAARGIADDMVVFGGKQYPSLPELVQALKHAPFADGDGNEVRLIRSIHAAEQGHDDELEPGDYVSPDRLARFTVERVEVPILTKPSAYQRQLLGNLTRLVADAHTDDRRGELAGRPGRLVTIRGIVRGQSPTPLPARIHCAIFVDEQVLTAVTAVAIGTGRAGVELDDTWASAQWRATLLESAPEAR